MQDGGWFPAETVDGKLLLRKKKQRHNSGKDSSDGLRSNLVRPGHGLVPSYSASGMDAEMLLLL